MDAVTIARWQFGITTVYHFFFVPITIALSMLVAVLQTIWVRNGDPQFLRLTKFFGKLFLINFAMGVVTGIVQEFQFGMNWSEYSRFVGDVFGAPLALEALIAFFLESTFIGLWIFGWDRLPKKLHLLTIYLNAIGTMLSAVFILAANSWMQNPVGATYRNGRAELTDFGALLTNPVFLTAFPHVIFAAYMTAGAMVAGICALHLTKLHQESDAGTDIVRNGRVLSADEVAKDLKTYRWGAKFGAWVLIAASVFTIITGDLQGKTMVQAQPMKMAAAEALYTTEQPASFSIFTIGSLDGSKELFSLRIPNVLSFLSTGSFDGKVQGINDIKASYEKNGFEQDNGSKNALQASYASTLKNYDVGSIVPVVPVTYWAFRLMIGLGMIGVLGGAWLLFALRGQRTPPNGSPIVRKLWRWTCVALPFLPLFAISFGWIFTEMGRQPWLVAGVLPTAAGVSPGVSAFSAGLTMVLYTLLYGALAVVEFGLILKYARAGMPDVEEPKVIEDEHAPLSFAY